MNELLETYWRPAAEELSGLWGQATEVWLGGGWAMIAIAVIALVMFSVGMHIHFALRRTGFQAVPERTWRRWIEHPRERRGPIGDLLDSVGGGATLADTARLFQQMRANETLPFERDLRVMKVCVSAAPLVGLLGTVTGMLSTFGALSGGSGGDKTMGLVAAGISEALITTETGLVIALPGLFFQYQLSRRHDRYKAFLAHVETVFTQSLYKQSGQQRNAVARRAAIQVIATRLRNRLAEMRASGTPFLALPQGSLPAIDIAGDAAVFETGATELEGSAPSPEPVG